MAKSVHEIRAPIHVFIRLDSQERKVLDSEPFQRLRHIHQLALSYLVYPGATHKRFEHSLGVMELAGRIFDVVTDERHLTDDIRGVLPELANRRDLDYWRRVVRMAALCHDLGHLPFSHAAENELLPPGWDHERLTREIILSEELKPIWESIRPAVNPKDIAKLATGPHKYTDEPFSPWEAILSEIIVGDAFGADRMDYLLRDSYHAGVAYGKFDHYRLIDTLRILPRPVQEHDESASVIHEPMLGIEEGGIQSAEALLLARYFMFSQVYLHPVRRIYDIHLKDFLKSFLNNGKFAVTVRDHLRMTDYEVLVALFEAARDPAKAGHDPARRIVRREHFRVLYQRHPNDLQVNPEPGLAIFEAAKMKFGEDSVRHDRYTQKGSSPDFPVLTRDGRIVSSLSVSNVLIKLPLYAIDYVFIAPEKLNDAKRWLERNRERIISAP